MRSPALPATHSQITSPSVTWTSSLVALITVAGAVLRFTHIAHKSFWLDEGVSVELARLHASDFAHILWRREANMSLYYLLLRGWLLLGGSEAWVRCLSALFAVATLPVVYLLGRQVAGRRAGIVAAALLAVHAWHIRYAQEARSYSLYVLLTAFSSLLFLRLLKNGEGEHAYTWASVLAVYSHFFAVLTLAAQWVAARFLPASATARTRFRRALQIIGIALLPIVVFIATHGMGPIAWIRRPGADELHRFFLFTTGNGSDVLLAMYVFCCASALWISRGAERSGVWFLAAWYGLPIVLTLAFSLVRAVFLPRYLVMCVAPLAVLAGAGLAKMRPRWMGAALLAMMLALSVRGTLAYYRADFDLGREDWRTCTGWMLENSAPGDGVLFHSAQARMPFEYYSDALPARTQMRVIFPAAAAGRLSYLDFVANAKNAPVGAVAAEYRRVWLVLAHNRLATGEADATTRNLESVLKATYGAPAEYGCAGVDVLLYGKPRPPR